MHPSINIPFASTPVEGDFVRINRITVFAGDGTSVGEGDSGAAGFDPNLEFTHIGSNIQFTATVNNDADRGIVIGSNYRGNHLRPNVVGQNVTAIHTVAPWSNFNENPFGGSSNPEFTIIGHDAIGAAWRGAQVGDRSVQLGQSGTVLGYGGVNLQSHGISLGRGGNVPGHTQIPEVGMSVEATMVYLANGWGHRINTPWSGINTRGAGPRTPSSEVGEYHGMDAFDARYPAWDANEDYVAPTSRFTGKIVQHAGVAYISLLGSGPSTQQQWNRGSLMAGNPLGSSCTLSPKREMAVEYRQSLTSMAVTLV